MRSVEATRLVGATRDERVRTVATLVSAFRADPVERWLYPGDQEYVARFPEFLAAFGGQAFIHDTVWQSNGFAAVALWLPPGASADGDEIARVLMATVDRSRHGDTTHPRFPHWYLPWFGVDAKVAGHRTRRRLAGAFTPGRGRHRPARLRGDPHPGHDLVLRATWVPGQRVHANRGLSSDHGSGSTRASVGGRVNEGQPRRAPRAQWAVIARRDCDLVRANHQTPREGAGQRALSLTPTATVRGAGVGCCEGDVR